MSRSERIVGLDIVRGLAAFAVALSHYCMAKGIAVATCENISILAVEVFFILSGFVLAPQIRLCLSGKRWENLKIFYLRRWYRTLVPFFFALLAISILTHRLFSTEFFRYLFFVNSFTSVIDKTDYYAPAWSLAVEEWFYIVFPLFLLCVEKIFPKPSKNKIYGLALAFLATWFLVKQGFAAHFGEEKFFLRRLTIFRLDSICFGFLLTFLFSSTGCKHVYAKMQNFLGTMHRPAVGASLTLLLGLAIVLLARLLAEPSLSITQAMLFTYLAPVLGITILLLACLFEAKLATAPLVSYISVFMGRISYSVYLFHMVFVNILLRYANTKPSVDFIVYVGILCAFSHYFYLFVEKPVLAARPNYKDSSQLSIL